MKNNTVSAYVAILKQNETDRGKIIISDTDNGGKLFTLNRYEANEIAKQVKEWNNKCLEQFRADVSDYVYMLIK